MFYFNLYGNLAFLFALFFSVGLVLIAVFENHRTSYALVIPAILGPDFQDRSIAMLFEWAQRMIRTGNTNLIVRFILFIFITSAYGVVIKVIGIHISNGIGSF